MLLILLALCLRKPNGISHLFSIAYALAGNGWLTLDTIHKPRERYLDQMLFHLMRDGRDNDVVRACSAEQRAFIVGFLEHVMDQYGTAMNKCTFLSDDILNAYEIWSV